MNTTPTIGWDIAADFSENKVSLSPSEVAFLADLIDKKAGMTLRDLFAIHAPKRPIGWTGLEDKSDNIARSILRADDEIYLEMEWRWFYADTMLKDREGSAA